MYLYIHIQNKDIYIYIYTHTYFTYLSYIYIYLYIGLHINTSTSVLIGFCRVKKGVYVLFPWISLLNPWIPWKLTVTTLWWTDLRPRRGERLIPSFPVTLPETNSKSTWKWMVGRWSFPFGMASLQVRTVSFRECISSTSEDFVLLQLGANKSPNGFFWWNYETVNLLDFCEGIVSGEGQYYPSFFGSVTV